MKNTRYIPVQNHAFAPRQKPNPLFKAILKAFKQTSYHHFIVGIDILYYSAFYKTHREVAKNPIHTFRLREHLLELFGDLDKSLPSMIGYEAPDIYRPRLFKKIIRHHKETPELHQDNKLFVWALWEYLPKLISDKELRKPYTTLRLCMIQLKSLDYKYGLQELQDLAFSGSYERLLDDMGHCYELYLVLRKTLEVCYLIYAAELNFGNPISGN